MVRIIFSEAERKTALQYLCTKGYLSPSDPDCMRVADLIEDTKIKRFEYENAGRMIYVFFDND
ncbi:MAG: hypothetical protein COB84_03970 [Rhodobacteraceae bacterium]|nr:MAG: hypothetical protein COB84_03970 [Paracoccaceae bacterium]